MAEPFLYQILKGMQGALQGIQTGSGYYHDVDPTSVAVKLDPDANIEEMLEQATYPYAIIEMDPNAWDYVEKPDGVLILHPFVIHFANIRDASDDDALMREWTRLIADVERAIAAYQKTPAATSLATDIRILSQGYRKDPEAAGRLTWSMSPGEIRERRTYGIPNV